MLGDGYELIAAAIHKPIPRGRDEVINNVGLNSLRAAKNNVAPKLPVRIDRSYALIGRKRTGKNWNVKLH
jgi:hypothetical protein